MHVFADLQSYLCTHEACRDALNTFPTRKLWADHEFNEHFTLRQWRCFTCRATTRTQQSFVDHLTNNHNIVLTGHRLTAAIAEAQETDLIPGFINHKCALCSKSSWQTKRAYATHVGQHLEEISLACLPRDEGDSSDDALDTDTSSAVTMINVVRLDQSVNHEMDPNPEIQNVQFSEPSSAPYQELLLDALPDMIMNETSPALFNHQVERIRNDAALAQQQVALPKSVHRYQPIAPKQNVPGLEIPRPLGAPGSPHVSGNPSAINEQTNEPVSAAVYDIETSNIENAAILHEPGATSSTSIRPTSYWSVDEQRDFPRLLAHFGLDFEGIANAMKNKTPTMVRLL
jgi:hypothetical protein